MKLLIKNGLILQPGGRGVTDELDILIEDYKVKKIDRDIVNEDALIIDAKNKLVVPGLIDVHVHFREPGQEYKENIYTGSCAAVSGGFTTVIAEPNTNPPIDTASRLKNVLEIAREQSLVHFFSKACISKRIDGKRLVNVPQLKQAGAKALSDDGQPVASNKLMRNALIKGKEYDILITPHCEESELYRQRMIEKLGRQFALLEPYTAEDRFIERDIKLAEETDANIHISHVSLASSVKKIAQAKKRGVKITAEATPHHFILSKENEKEIGTNAKVNPPLRAKEDVEAIKEGLSNGIIDIIASDHAPHTPAEKTVPWEQAPFGIIGLETTLGLVLTYLVKPGILTLKQAIEKMTILPAKIFGLAEAGFGTLTPNISTDITIIDLEKKWKVDVDKFYSKGRNCPFNGWELQGKATTVIVKGQVMMKDGDIL
ncbi:MAG: dihydroorotase [bacterium]